MATWSLAAPGWGSIAGSSVGQQGETRVSHTLPEVCAVMCLITSPRVLAAPQTPVAGFSYSSGSRSERRERLFPPCDSLCTRQSHGNRKPVRNLPRELLRLHSNTREGVSQSGPPQAQLLPRLQPHSQPQRSLPSQLSSSPPAQLSVPLSQSQAPLYASTSP